MREDFATAAEGKAYCQGVTAGQRAAALELNAVLDNSEPNERVANIEKWLAKYLPKEQK